MYLPLHNSFISFRFFWSALSVCVSFCWPIQHCVCEWCDSLSSVDPGLAYCVLSMYCLFCLCITCVFSIVSKSLGRDNSELRVSRICMVVHRTVTKTVGVFDNSALIHLDLGLVFYYLDLVFCFHCFVQLALAIDSLLCIRSGLCCS